MRNLFASAVNGHQCHSKMRIQKSIEVQIFNSVTFTSWDDEWGVFQREAEMNLWLFKFTQHSMNNLKRHLINYIVVSGGNLLWNRSLCRRDLQGALLGNLACNFNHDNACRPYYSRKCNQRYINAAITFLCNKLISNRNYACKTPLGQLHNNSFCLFLHHCLYCRVHSVEWQDNLWLVNWRHLEGSCGGLRQYSGICLEELRKPTKILS
jgi:hypothetical protein